MSVGQIQKKAKMKRETPPLLRGCGIMLLLVITNSSQLI